MSSWSMRPLGGPRLLSSARASVIAVQKVFEQFFHCFFHIACPVMTVEASYTVTAPSAMVKSNLQRKERERERDIEIRERRRDRESEGDRRMTGSLNLVNHIKKGIYDHIM
jgi:hypothetical protein